MVESKPRKAVKNWFDSDEDGEDAKSMHSSEATLTGRDEEEGNAPRQSQLGHTSRQSQVDFEGTKTEVSTGAQSWVQGVNITREVVVETTMR